MLNSNEHGHYHAHKCQNADLGCLTFIRTINTLQKSLKARQLFILSILEFMSSLNFMLICVEHEEKLYKIEARTIGLFMHTKKTAGAQSGLCLSLGAIII